MTRDQATDLVNDLLDAAIEYERAETAATRRTREAYHQKREAVIAALSTPDRVEPK